MLLTHVRPCAAVALGALALTLLTEADAAASPVVLRPDGDVVRQWTGGTPGTAAAALDDPVVQPAPVPAADYIYAGTVGRRTEVTLADQSLGGGSARLTAWFYANTGTTTRLRVEVVQAANVLAATTVGAGAGFAWRSLTGPALAALPQGSLSDMRLRFTTLDGGDSNVRAAYAETTVTPCTPEYGTFGPGAWPAACWRPFGSTSPFNRPLPANPRPIDGSQQRSDAIRDRILGDISAIDRPAHLAATTAGTSGEPTYYSRPGDPVFTIDCVLYGGVCSIDGLPVAIPRQAAPEGGWGAAASADRHITVVDQQTGWEYDLWQVRGSALPADGGVLPIGYGGRARIDRDCAGVPADGTSCEPAGVPGGQGTAAHFADLAGRLRVEELDAGRIEHALFIVIDCDSAQIVYPARGHGQSCAYAQSTDPAKDPSDPALRDPTHPDNVDAPPMGALLQLDLTAAQIDALPIRQWKKTLLHAMAEYGAYFGDTGSRNLFAIEAEAGNQYTAFGYADPWWKFGGQYWEPYTEGGATSYIGKLYNRPDDPDPNLNWMSAVWSHVRILDPCVAAGTC
jgi:hypothetical protein